MYLTALLDTPSKARLDITKTGRVLIMNQARLFSSPNYKNSTQTAMENNYRCLDNVIRKFPKYFFLDNVPKTNCRGRVRADSRQQQLNNKVEEMEDKDMSDDFVVVVTGI